MSTAGRDEVAVRRYIQEQETEDKRLDKLTLCRIERLTETIIRFEQFTLYQASGFAGGC